MAAGDERRKRALVLSRVHRVRRRLDTQVALELAPVPLWACATAFLVWRVFIQRAAPVAGVVLGVAALVAMWLLFSRRRVSTAEAAVVADRLSGAQGLLLTRLEVPVGAWELGLNERLRDVPSPPIEVKKSAALISGALLFWAIAALVPLPQRVGTPRNAAGETRVEELAQKLEAVAKEEPVGDAAQDVLEDLKQQLEDGRFDAADWEAADALDAELDKKAVEAQAELSRAEEAAKNFQQALEEGASGEAQAKEREALESALLALADGRASSGADALAEALEQTGSSQSGKNGEGQQKAEQSEKGEQGQGGGAGQGEGKQGQSGAQGQQGSSPSGKQGVSRAQADDLRKALEQRQQQLSKATGNSSSAQRQASRSSGQGQSGGKGPKGKGEGQKGKGEGQGEGEGQSEGEGQQGKNGEGHASRGAKGGPSHGPGEGELVFGGEAEMNPDRLAFTPLPEGQGGEADELWGLQRADPGKHPAGARAGGSGAEAAGNAAPTNREGELLPRNRALIQRYFDSNASH